MASYETPVESAAAGVAATAPTTNVATTSEPAGYRPGGTSTYPSSGVAVATRPDGAAGGDTSGTTPAATQPGYASPYPSTQYR